MKKRIIVSVTSDLCTDQRVQKVCMSLHQAGYDIFLIGRKLSKSQDITLPYKYLRIRLIFNRSFLFYTEFNFRIFIILLFTKADLFYANDTDALPANFLASLVRRKKFVFDAHELFPEVPELVDRPKIKAFWTKIEDVIIPKSMYNITVCDSIAEYYQEKYQVPFEVVRNVPYLSNIKDEKRKFGKKKIIIYQGAVNMGRGLELVIDAMSYVSNTVLWIIGDGDVKKELEKKVIQKKLERKVIFEGKVDAKVLKKMTMSADIGLCLLENKGLSYYYALPNRIFDYMHAGIPVLTSPFPEISKIVDEYKTGITTLEKKPKILAKIITDMLENPIDTSHFEALSKEFCWEKEEAKLLYLIKKALY